MHNKLATYKILIMMSHSQYFTIGHIVMQYRLTSKVFYNLFLQIPINHLKRDIVCIKNIFLE